MKDLIESFPAQLEKAVDIARNARLSKPGNRLANVLISGLGGSGIGGTIVSEMAALETPVPIVVNKGYFIPGWVSSDTLVIISSYSGNTEETINAMKLAESKGAKIVCITSGGFISGEAAEKGYDLITVPGGSQPRACLGYSFVQLLRIFHFFGLIKNDPLPSVLNSVLSLRTRHAEIIAEAQSITEFFSGKIPVLYSTTFREGIAIRWRQQLNENAKMLCWHHVVPEMNHNELVGWKNKNDQFAVLFLRDKSDYIRNQRRIEINKKVISEGTEVRETWAEGNDLIEKNIWQINLGDWVSWFLSQKNEVDANEVKVIDYLKNELAKN